MYEQQYPSLFRPLRLRGLTMRNRIMSAPNMLFQTIGGKTTDAYLHYLEAKARGGAGLVTLGEVPVCDGGCHTPGTEFSRENLAVFSEMSAVIREHGALSSVELTHGGMKARHQFNKKQPMGPDETENGYGPVRAMTREDMEDVAEAFADAAEYWYEAGFDTVLIHAAHGWLFPQFLSPLTNHRTDEFGGSLENRMRFPLMTLRRIRERVGPDRVVMIRLSGADRDPGGMTAEEVTEFLSRAQEYVDLAEISSEGITWFFGSPFRPWCLNSDLSAAVKADGRIRIPVFSIGSILSPEMAEDLIASGKCDGVSMSRALIADPCLPRKAAEGRGAEARPCLRCLNCTDGDNLHRHFSCTVNPLTGHEDRLGYEDEGVSPARHPRRVLVVGGGPAGLTAAVTAARRGHEVVLCEKGDRLGGTVNFCDTDSLKKDLRRWRDWLLREAERENIDVRLHTEVTPELAKALEPDHIIVAAGAEPVTPGIPGIENARHALAAYEAPESVGARVVIVGGGLVGVECALHLRNTGHEVTVLEAMDEAARDAGPVYRIGLMAKVRELGLEIVTGAKVEEIAPEGVLYKKDDAEVFLPADTALYAVGMRSRTELYLALAPLAPHVDLVGDCRTPGKLLGAIHGGYFAGMDVGRA